MELLFEQIQHIVKDNPNKDAIEKGREKAKKLMLHIHGLGLDSAIKHNEYFSSKEIYDVQKKDAISNQDVFGRILQQEEMVFSARGGSSHFNLPEQQENQMNEILDDVRYGMNLRKWVKTFALQAYRADPMGVIFMEIDTLQIDSNGQMKQPKAYPTYKSIFCIYDYLSNGRKLEYVVFKLKVAECKSFGIIDETFKNQKADAETEYYRIVDDKKDVIVIKKDGVVSLVTNIDQPNPLPNDWARVPGFIVSDLIRFNDTREFVSPVDLIVELADCFLYDRSIRDLQKKYHGFAKAIEPLLKCPECMGEGVVMAGPCPSCTPHGALKGSGYKLKTKVSDVSKFPLEILEAGSFDWRKIFGYVTPDIAGWEKQDRSLDDLEELMEMTYWGTIRMKRPKPGPDGQPVTATEVNSNDAPKEARLNQTADWVENTENLIADFLGEFWFDKAWKGPNISLGRDYILKTADELLDIYETIRTKGAPDFLLDMALEKYLRAKYQNNPMMMAIYLKKLDVEPFPHLSLANSKGIITSFDDYNAKLYFGEWCNTIPDAFWINKQATELRTLLAAYVKAKGIKEPEPQPNPVLN